MNKSHAHTARGYKRRRPCSVDGKGHLLLEAKKKRGTERQAVGRGEERARQGGARQQKKLRLNFTRHAPRATKGAHGSTRWRLKRWQVVQHAAYAPLSLNIVYPLSELW